VSAGAGTVAHDGRGEPAVAGRTLFDYADLLRVEVATSCRRSGRCHECVVEVTGGADALSPPSPAEAFLRPPYRLACQAALARDDAAIAFAPLRRRPKILTGGLDRPAAELDPAVTLAGDEVRLDGRAIDRFRGRLLGLAIDLGTTTLVIDLVDLASGRVLGTASCANPQRFGGSDVMHRITYDCGHPGELQRSAVAALNGEIGALCERLGLPRRAIYEVAIAGNSTMRDLFFRLDVQPIGQRPYKSVVETAWRAGERPHTALEENAQRLGLKVHPKARAYGLPLVASHVGGDMAADLVAIDRAFGSAETAMLVDIGTNTEVAVLHGRRLMVASCPAGPAFEGGLVTYGMPGQDGAVERLRLAPDGRCVEHRTIGEVPAQGLCGSGLIDLLAELRRHGLMTAKGVFTADRRRQSIAVLPERGITFSREDASHLAQAKAANTSGQWIVMRAFGVEPAGIDRLYLAGGFANYIDVGNAIAIGLLPPVPEARIVKIGNAAVEGARRVLLSVRLRRALEERVKEAEHIELETTPDFFEIFVEGCQLKPMPDRLRQHPPHPVVGLAS
jgi:uncharacterized 2Fe-2S/4Fe-4S cluster protein (DUF4445 family)